MLEQDYIYYIGEGVGDKIHTGAGLYILHWGGGMGDKIHTGAGLYILHW